VKALRSILVIVLVSLTISPALAASKLVTPAPMTLIANILSEKQVTGALVKAKSIFLYGNNHSDPATMNSHGFIEAMDETGATLWSLPLQSGTNDVITCATFDAKGHIWVVGTSGPMTDAAATTASQSPTVLNPDSVVPSPVSPLRSDLTTLVLWEVDQSGNLISTFRSDLSRSAIARGIVSTSTGFAITGIVATISGTAGFFLQMDSLGTFGKIQIIGSTDTEISSIVANSTGFLLSGSSVEKLAGKPLLGSRDAIAVSLTADGGKISSIVRSTNASTMRTWRVATPSLFLGGDAVVSGKISAVVTKFSSKMVPTWTTRFPATGPAHVVDASPNRLMVFASNSPLIGIGGWKPTKPSLIAIGFDAKGLIMSAFSAKSVSQPLAIGYSAALGLVVVGRTGEKGVSIFHALTR